MHLVQILLPLYDNDGRPLPRELFVAVRDELTERFGGLTAHTRAPAVGLWKDDSARPTRDDIVIYEVMTAKLNRAWWKKYRRALEARFKQELVVVRAQKTQVL